MTDERYSATYATQDGETAFEVVGVPLGYILPPTLTVPRSGFGEVVFYWAEMYGIDVRGLGRNP